MNKDFFAEYKFLEHEKAKLISGSLLNDKHVLTSPKDLYPEYKITDSVAFHRPGVNIGALLFLYRQVVVYVPPIAKEKFSEKFGIDYYTFIELCKPIDNAPSFILPILNHPKHYAKNNLNHELKELLELKPPTWERWHKVLEITGGTKWFDLADRTLNYKKLYSFPEYRNYWKTKLKNDNDSYISREIKQQIKNNFTDLCLIGLEDQALEIAETSHKHPDFAINDLMYSADTFAYPKIMGANGYANIKSENGLILPLDSNSSWIKKKLSKKGVDSDVIETIAEGLKFDFIPKVFRLSFLIEWHKQQWAQYAKDFYGKLLEELKKNDPDENLVYKNIKEVIGLLKNFCELTQIDERKINNKIDEKNRTKSVATFSVSTLFGIGGLFGNALLMFVGSTGSSLIGISSNDQRLKLLKRMWKRHYDFELPPDIIDRFLNMYNFKKERIDDNLTTEYSSIKDITFDENIARNVWW